MIINKTPNPRFHDKRWLHMLIIIVSVASLSHYAYGLDEPAATEKVDETKIIASDDDKEEGKDGAASAATLPKNVPAQERLSKEKKSLLVEAAIKPVPVWLTASTQKILSFWHSDLSGKPVGALLLLHGQGETPITPIELLNLQQNLPLQGWATLSVELPSPPRAHIPKRPALVVAAPLPADEVKTDAKNTDSENVDETKVVFDDSKEQASPVEPAIAEKMTTISQPTAAELDQQAIDNINSALDYLREQGQHNIAILGDGFGAFRALQLLQQSGYASSNTDQPIQALILLNVQNNTNAQAESLLDLLSNYNIPILDVFTQTTTRSVNDANERKIISKKNRIETYRQMQLPPNVSIISDSGETRLTKTIRGFLDRFAKGKEL